MTQDTEITQLPSADASPEPAEPELFCPNCDYNLRGLPTDICPECGKPYDRETLLFQATSENIPMRVWLKATGFRAWFSLFGLCLFSPGRLGQMLPASPNLSELFWYGMAMRIGASAIIAAAISFPDQPKYPLQIIVMILSAVLVGSLCCEWILVFLLSLIAKPLGVQTKDVGHFWRGLCYCLSSYLASSSVGLAIGLILLGSTRRSPSDIAAVLANLLPLIATGWWWHSLGQAIRKRTLPSLGRTIMPLISALVALLAIIFGYVCGLCAPVL